MPAKTREFPKLWFLPLFYDIIVYVYQERLVMSLDIIKYLNEKKRLVDDELARVVPLASSEPVSIHEAMRYSLFAGGKRIRPILALATAEMLGGDEKLIIRPACALELIHTYSLIHDDLPALDNDDLRRGMPTCHKKFGEAMAILAGDALLTHAFQVLSEPDSGKLSPENRLRVINLVAEASGTAGMAGGQVADLEAENRVITKEELKSIHSRKTGALISASILLGAYFSDADDGDIRVLTSAGDAMGTLFQVVDDILDVEGDTALLGKKSGADESLNKATYPSLYGLEESKRIAKELHGDVISLLSRWSGKAGIMTGISSFILNRHN